MLAAPCCNVAASDGDVDFPEVGSGACCCAMDEGEELAVAAPDVAATLLVAAPVAEAVSVARSVNAPEPVVALAGGGTSEAALAVDIVCAPAIGVFARRRRRLFVG